jgi:hypothetical protein
MRGDRVEIVIDAGDTAKTYEVSATRAGRRVEVVTRRGLVEVTELTRGGSAVRTARFMVSRVIAVVEHPAPGRGKVARLLRRAFQIHDEVTHIFVRDRADGGGQGADAGGPAREARGERDQNAWMVLASGQVVGRATGEGRNVLGQDRAIMLDRGSEKLGI